MPTGKLTIVSNPSNANVFIGEEHGAKPKSVGKTPLFVSLEYGSYVIKFEKKGYVDRSYHGYEVDRAKDTLEVNLTKEGEKRPPEPDPFKKEEKPPTEPTPEPTPPEELPPLTDKPEGLSAADRSRADMKKLWDAMKGGRIGEVADLLLDPELLLLASGASGFFGWIGQAIPAVAAKLGLVAGAAGGGLGKGGLTVGLGIAGLTIPQALGKLAVKGAVGIAGFDGIMVWMAEDNILTGVSFTMKKLRDAVGKGMFSPAEVNREMNNVQGWINAARKVVETSVDLNPFVMPFKGILLINADKAQKDFDLEKALILKKFEEKK